MKKILSAIGFVEKELGCQIRVWRIQHRKTLSDLGPEPLLDYLNKESNYVGLGNALDSISKEQSVALRNHLRDTLLRRRRWSRHLDREFCTYLVLIHESGEGMPTQLMEHLERLGPRVKHSSAGSEACDLLVDMEGFYADRLG
jgi:hypothetical protein